MEDENENNEDIWGLCDDNNPEIFEAIKRIKGVKPIFNNLFDECILSLHFHHPN